MGELVQSNASVLPLYDSLIKRIFRLGEHGCQIFGQYHQCKQVRPKATDSLFQLSLHQLSLGSHPMDISPDKMCIYSDIVLQREECGVSDVTMHQDFTQPPLSGHRGWGSIAQMRIYSTVVPLTVNT